MRRFGIFQSIVVCDDAVPLWSRGWLHLFIYQLQSNHATHIVVHTIFKPFLE